jgi:hypothetical protein
MKTSDRLKAAYEAASKAASESEQTRRDLARANNILRDTGNSEQADALLLKHAGNDAVPSPKPSPKPSHHYEMADAEARSQIHVTLPPNTNTHESVTKAGDAISAGKPADYDPRLAPAAPKENDKDLYLSGKPDYSQIDLPTGHYRTPTPAEPWNPKYSSLHTVLKAAYAQASEGKGKERHAGNGLAFTEQPMQTVSKLLGTSDGLAFQAIKKVTEAKGMETFEQKERELLGAINYIAGIIIFEKNKEGVA